MNPTLQGPQDTVQAIFEALQQTEKGKKSGAISRETVIADLGIDSISLLEVVGILEDRFDVVLADEDITGIQTIGELEGLIHKRRAGGSAAEGA